MLRYERSSDELSGLSDRLALPEDLAGLMAPIRANGSFRPKGRAAGPRDRLTDAVIEMIARGAAAEIAYFGYAPPPLAAPAA